ncbi:methionyl-tRNA formyltransferase [Patescibacteria group bacterium]|nr:methionyl-tRNA formyltransferase [Patescibacteria group bacterium]MBU1672902.1 methionyl-tRNA formyltransferase [Patescibacteria group bacterium]MBU1963153.1 methionyl-tRNA formyltransferase [Patescibacteria group bacterium]
MTNILFFGTPDFAIPSLKSLLDEGDFLITVITQPDKPVGRKKILTPPPVALLAKEKNLELHQPEKLSSDFIKNLKPDLGIVVAYGKIIPQEILGIPTCGFINLHPSLLPDLRGPSPMQSALLNGYPETGITIMELDKGMDSGPILSQQIIKIPQNTDYPALSNICAQEGAELLVKTIKLYLKNSIKPQPQDGSKATFSKMIKREDGEIDIKKDEPVEIMNKLRAYTPWPGIFFKWKDKRYKIKKAHLKGEELVIAEIQPEGKQSMSYAEFLKGHPTFSELSQ